MHSSHNCFGVNRWDARGLYSEQQRPPARSAKAGRSMQVQGSVPRRHCHRVARHAQVRRVDLEHGASG
jgi:hypothetical protein